MSDRLVEINWRPSDRQLRQFGVISLFALPLAGWLVMGRPVAFAEAPIARNVLVTLAALGAVAATLGLLRPQMLRPVFVGACLVSFPIGLVAGELTMLLIYFGVFLPV